MTASTDTPPCVLALDRVRPGDVAVAGGKGANLAALLAAGLPVPGGFVVTVGAYDACMAASGLAADIAALPAGEPGAAARAALREGLQHVVLPDALTREIAAAVAAADAAHGSPVIWAVRSSATVEDAAGASYAGQHATYYYVAGQAVPDMVRYCWASLFGDHAAAYRESRGVPHAHARMAVVVQRLVNADVSGVTFSADPVSGDPGAIVTESTWGLGAALVDGRVTPDRFVVARADGRVRERRIADKRVMVPPGIEGGAVDGSRLRAVPAARRRRATLDDAALGAVSALAVSAEAACGAPQDIEWALEDGHLWLLQSRPITTLTPVTESPPPGRYVVFKPLLENFTEPLTPLSADLFGSVAAPGYVIHKGRVYVSLEEIRRVVPFRLDDAAAARLGYLGKPDPDAPRPPLSVARLAGVLLGLAVLGLQFGVFLGRTRALPDDALEPFRRRAQAVLDDPSLDARQAMWSLIGLDARFLAPVGELPLPVNLGASRYFAWLGVLKLLIARWAPGLPPDTAALLTAGSEGMKSAEMGREVRALAARARAVPAVARVILEQPPGEVLPILRRTAGAGAFLHAFGAFLDAHGHRAVREFEFAVPRWREDPSTVFGMVRNYLGAAAAPASAEEAGRARRRAREAALAAALRAHPGEALTGLRARLVALCVRRVKYFTKLRENSRYYHIMINDVVRAKLLALERRLLASGALKCAGDAFFLRYAELEALAAGELTHADVEQRLHERRLAWVRECGARPARTLGFDPPAPRAPDGARLHGFGASPGYCEGRARVIRDPGVDATLAPGEILVAPYTDPAWTPLFLTARAAVVEVGSYLSHAGTVAREYGMPCVVDVEGCTSRIADGARLAVDGDTGIVTLLDEAPPE